MLFSLMSFCDLKMGQENNKWVNVLFYMWPNNMEIHSPDDMEIQSQGEPSKG